MSNDQQNQQNQQSQQGQQPAPPAAQQAAAELQQIHDQDTRQEDHPDVDGLKDKKPEELTPEELRLMADTMPGEGPGD